jgi:prepilin-type N-terminal cleavage/methylation domain-containing protein
MTRTSKAGTTSNPRERGVTLIEMLIVVAIAALIAGLSYAPVTAGLETLRLRAASDQVVGFLSAAQDRADRKQTVVEIQILPVDKVLLARSADRSFAQRVDLPQNMRIVNIQPAEIGSDPKAVRRFLIYPGGSVPRIAVELQNSRGRRRNVSLDPFTGMARAVEVVEEVTP